MPTLPVDPRRVVADLHALAERTSDERGAQRIAWSTPWDDARRWLEERLPLGVDVWRDGADNLWAEWRGASGAPVIAVGSHLDSVPDGGWLDGCLGVVAALELLRAAAECSWDEATLRLVDWADEEGRFGHSLLGSSAATGQIDLAHVRTLRDRDGASLEEVFAGRGLTPESLTDVHSGLGELDALLELHIEQGPALELAGAPLGVPTGSAAIHRMRMTFAGQAAHAGTTPMDARRDAGLASAALALAVRAVACEHGGVGTVGAVALEPGMATVVPGRAAVTIDLRHPRDDGLAAMVDGVRERARAIAVPEDVSVAEEMIWSFPAVAVDARLVGLARRAAGGDQPALISGALHDAVAAAHHGVPTAMLFVRSIGGLSHDRREDTAEADLVAGVEALARTVALAAQRP
jgi:N-carbamoyl-L-amino-acid hydrolase